MVEVYRVVPGRGPRPEVSAVADVRVPTLPADYDRASADRLAERIASGRAETHGLEPLGSGGELLRVGGADPRPGRPAGGRRRGVRLPDGRAWPSGRGG